MEGINFNGLPINGETENNIEEEFVTPQVNQSPVGQITLRFGSPWLADSDDLSTPTNTGRLSALVSPEILNETINTPINEHVTTDDIPAVNPGSLFTQAELERAVNRIENRNNSVGREHNPNNF